MIALGDLELRAAEAGVMVYAANGINGGVTVRDGLSGQLRDQEAFSQAAGLPSGLGLKVLEGGDAPILFAAGQYGRTLDGWEISADGTLGASRPVTLNGGGPGGFSDLVQITDGAQQMLVTASRFATGLELWTRDGATFTFAGGADSTGFLAAGSVQSLAVAYPGGAPVVLAASSNQDDLLAFSLQENGGLGSPHRLDLRDGSFIDTPTRIEVVVVDGQSFAVMGSAGSSSVSVVAIYPGGEMQVTDQVNDTTDTFFAGTSVLEVLETSAGVFVLAGGTDNGLTLMVLGEDGVLAHVASVTDEMRDMALQNIGGVDMIWRDGGLEFFLTGKVEDADTIAGRGISHLRIDDLEDQVPTVQTGSASHVYVGTAGADLFRVSGTREDQVIQGYDPDMDQLDLSQMGRFFDLSDLDIVGTADGAVFQFEGAKVTVQTDDGQTISVRDLVTSDLQDLWHVDVTPSAPQNAVGAGEIAPENIGGPGADFLDGRAGDDTLLGELRDVSFDTASAKVFRLYQATLDRDPDPTGLINWSTRLETGERSLIEVVEGFTGSAEFTQTYGITNPQQFVTLLYDNVLGRAPDAQGLANWSERIESGQMSRAQVVQGFSESDEFQAKTASHALSFSKAGLQADFADDVYRLYRATLDRDPDLQGFINWSERLADGMIFTTVVEGLTGSVEFAQTYGATNTQQFVKLLYANVLDRPPDDRGLTNWSGRLDSGEMSRAQVVQGFSQSSEFIIATLPDLTDWVVALGPDDVLNGGGGVNLLMGGMFSDTFMFRAEDQGQHTVVDLEPWDVLQFDGFGYETTEEVLAHVSADAQDLVFSDMDVSIRFLDTQMATLQELVLVLDG